MSLDVTVVVPTIPPRAEMLARAVASVHQQTLPAADIVVALDDEHAGAAVTRNRGLEQVHTEWLIWLDDDDQLMPNALQVLTEAQQATGADVVSGQAWIPQRPGRGHTEPTEPLPPGWIDPTVVRASSRLTVTSLMRTEQVRSVGGFEFRRDPGTNTDLDDYGLYCKLADAEATFYRITDITFIWNVHGRNTSGRW